MRTDKSRVALDLAGFDDYLRVFEPPELLDLAEAEGREAGA